MKRIIVNGTFDIVHRGHIEMLNYARSLGDYLVVCIDTDARVQELKGLDRPINNQYDRKFLLENLKCVDQVWLFDSEDALRDLLKEYKPHVMVKGSDYQGRPIVGQDLCPKIEFFNLLDDYSTTKTIQRITNR